MGTNDMLRKTMITSENRKVRLTEIVAASPSREKVIDAVRNYDSFDTGNDPHGEHDFGQVTVDDEKYFFKIDYFDQNYEYGADPRIDDKYSLVLTIMEASEY
jgi:hypothetical protein